MSQEYIEQDNNSNVDGNSNNNGNHKSKKPSTASIILSYLLSTTYWLLLIFLAIGTFLLKDPTSVFTLGLFILSLFSIVVGWYNGFWSRLKSIIRYIIIIGISLLLMANGFSIITHPIQGLAIGIGALLGIQIFLSFLPIPKISTGIIDSLLGIAFQVTQTIILVALLAFLSTFRISGPSIMPKIAETIPAQIVKHLSPKLNNTLRKTFISSENQHLIESPSDTNGLMFALSIERGLLEPIHDTKHNITVESSKKELVFPFRGKKYRIKDPALIKAIQQKMQEVLKKRAH